MTISELIHELQKLDPEMPVCGQSETATWDIRAKDLIPTENVYVRRWGIVTTMPGGMQNDTSSVYKKALILGYKH